MQGRIAVKVDHPDPVRRGRFGGVPACRIYVSSFASFGLWKSPAPRPESGRVAGNKSGGFTFPYVNYSELADEFIKSTYDHGWVLRDFDCGGMDAYE